ncbi:MAG: 50S ribosomal protein L18 [Patescibacteria group bacterium]|nr:50S ribosomal protein L18 [Patescibacteria group bacterium]
MLEKQQKRCRRHKRIRAKIKGTSKVPRLCVFRSAKHIYAQLINDEKGRTIVAVSDLKSKIKNKKAKIQIKDKKPTSLPKELQRDKEEKDKEILTEKVAVAFEVGKLVAKKALEKKIKKVVFDRGGYKYHGRVKAVAEGAREGGLKF